MVEREGQHKMMWTESSGAQLAGGVAGGCAIHPASKPRGVSLQTIIANQHSNSKVGSGDGLLIVQGGGPMASQERKCSTATSVTQL